MYINSSLLYPNQQIHPMPYNLPYAQQYAACGALPQYYPHGYDVSAAQGYDVPSVMMQHMYTGLPEGACGPAIPADAAQETALRPMASSSSSKATGSKATKKHCQW